MRVNSIGYSPALDGLRALCLLAVLTFHAGYPWAGGGFLGVSTFFTLSGYLLTTLLLTEQRRSGSIAVGAFWSRRLRRLAPAALLTIVGILLTAPYWMDFVGRERLPSDSLTSLVYATNWYLLLGGYDYALIFSEPSPLQHFWSLAIEAQFYLIYPLLILLLVRRSAVAIRIGLLIVTAASILLPFVFEDMSRIYYGSDTRVSELLIGACLAALSDSSVPREDAPPNISLDVVGLGVLLGMAAIWSTATIESTWLYRAGFSVYAVGSAIIVYCAMRDGWTARLLRMPGLPWLGRISYGAYVYHWPIFLAFDETATGLSDTPLFALRLALTLSVAQLSYHFVESPIRRASATQARVFVGALAAATLAVSVAAVASSPAGFTLQFRDYVESLRQKFIDPTQDLSGIRIAWFGDSTALRLGMGVSKWARQSDQVVTVPGTVLLGCGILEGRLLLHDIWTEGPRECRDYLANWRDTAAENPTDIALVLTGIWEVRNRILSGDPEHTVRIPGDPLLDEFLERAINNALDALTPSANLVLWLTAPTFTSTSYKEHTARSEHEASDPARVARFNAILREVAASRPTDVRIIEFGSFIENAESSETYDNLRPDGTHLSLEGSVKIAEDWLGNDILRAYSRWVRVHGDTR